MFWSITIDGDFAIITFKSLRYKLKKRDKFFLKVRTNNFQARWDLKFV